MCFSLSMYLENPPDDVSRDSMDNDTIKLDTTKVSSIRLTFLLLLTMIAYSLP